MSKHKFHKPADDVEPVSSKGTREVMLKPSWPGIFHRTVGTGEQAKRLEFAPGEPVEVTDEEFKALKPDVGVCLFEVQRDEKGRPRAVDSKPESVPTERKETDGENV